MISKLEFSLCSTISLSVKHCAVQCHICTCMYIRRYVHEYDLPAVPRSVKSCVHCVHVGPPIIVSSYPMAAPIIAFVVIILYFSDIYQTWLQMLKIHAHTHIHTYMYIVPYLYIMLNQCLISCVSLLSFYFNFYGCTTTLCVCLFLGC